MHRNLWNLTRLKAIVAAVIIYVSSAGIAAAQGNSLFGNTGPASGSNGFSAGSTLSSGMGQSGMFGSSGMGSQAAGSSGLGGLGSSQGQFGGTQTGFGTQSTGQQRDTFVGQSNAGRFVGTAQAGTQQQGNRNGRNQINPLNRAVTRRNVTAGFQNQNQNGFDDASGGTASQRVIRPQQRVAFRYRAPTTESTTTILTARFEKLADRMQVSGVTIEADGENITLRGRVDSEDTRRLAAMLVGLEPGVRSVTNELTVDSP